MTRQQRNKIAACKELQGKSVADVVAMPLFLDNLAAYLNAQREDRAAIKSSYKAMAKAGGAKGYKLPAHVIDHLADLTPEQMAGEFLLILGRASTRSAAEREYIRQISMQAYNLAVAQIVIKEFPEMEDILLPTSKTN